MQKGSFCCNKNGLYRNRHCKCKNLVQIKPIDAQDNIYLDCDLNNNFTDEGIKNLPLTYLDCGWNNNFTDEGIKNLPLTHLNLTKFVNIF